MIPKIIHYCWFGGSPLPDNIKKNIYEWEKKLPEYKFVLWNETNFDINEFKFCTEAYDSKKYAFVSDVARLYGLKKYGGVYLDTDVEVVKDFSEEILNYSQVFSLENGNRYAATSFLASEKDGEIISDMLDDYRDRQFINLDGSLNTIPNTEYLTEKLKINGLKVDKINDKKQIIKENIVVYPEQYFSSYDLEISKPLYSNSTFLVHHFDASWESDIFRKKQMVKKWLLKLLGEKKYIKLKRLIKKSEG